jgi:hypothetical protein
MLSQVFDHCPEFLLDKIPFTFDNVIETITNIAGMAAILPMIPSVILKHTTAESAFRLNRRLLVSGVSVRAPPGTSASFRAKGSVFQPCDLRNRHSTISAVFQVV